MRFVNRSIRSLFVLQKDSQDPISNEHVFLLLVYKNHSSFVIKFGGYSIKQKYCSVMELGAQE